MLRKTVLFLFSLVMLLFWAMPVYASGQPTTATQPTTTPPVTTTSTVTTTPAPTSGPFSALAQDDTGIRPLTPINLNSLGNKAVNFGNRSYDFLLKGSVPLFVWAIGGSVLILILGIFFGKKVIIAGVTGILISLAVVVLIHYLPQIVLTAKNAAGSALAP